MSELVKITTHVDDAIERLPEQYRGKPKLEALLRGYAERTQTLEDVMFEVLRSGALVNAYGAILDQIGDIVDQPRGGRNDAKYKLRIVAKIGQNLSRGTAEDLIQIFKTLMQADRIHYTPSFPAGLNLTAIGVDPVGTTDEVKAAMEFSHAGGVAINLYSVVDSISFSFQGDPDPNAQGFGDYNDSSVGGALATIF